MKKTTKLLTVLVALAMIVSSFAMLATNKVHVYAAEPAVGTEYKLGTVGTDNVNGDFTVYMIERVKPDTWDGFNASAPFKYADMKAPVIEGGAYVDKYHNDPKNQDITDTMTTSAAGDINTQVRPGICKVLVFKAPVAGTYTVSANVRTYSGAAAFVSVGANDLEKVKQFAHAADDTLNYTVELKAGETFNIGLSRAYGANNADVDPFSDRVGFVVKNFKVTLDAIEGKVAAGTKFNISGANKNEAFSFGIIEREIPAAWNEGKWTAPVASSKFVAFESTLDKDSSTSDGFLAGAGKEYYNGAPSAQIGWSDKDVDGYGKYFYVANDGVIHSSAACYTLKVIKFTAPVSGTYTVESSAISYSGAYVATAVGETDLAVKDTWTESKVTKNYVETFELEAGESYYFGIGRNSGGNRGDVVTYYGESFAITLDSVAGDNVETVVYDINEYFGKTDSAPFSFHNYNTDSFELGSAIEPITGTGDNGTGYKNDAWTSYQPAKYNQLTRVDSEESGSRPKGTIWGVLAGNASIAVLFTAPADGEYGYHMTATRWWPNNEQHGGTVETQPSAVTVKHGDVVETAKMETGKLSNYVKGTATLKAGETILFYVDSLKNGAGDDYTLNTLVVTTTKSAPEEEVCDHAGAEWTVTDTKHSKVCECGEVLVAEADHDFGTNGVCECGFEQPETPCTEHKGGEATCTKKAVCSECGAEYGELAAHKYSEATCTAKAKCSVCGNETGELKAHSYSEATCTAKAKCSVCGNETGELKAHNYKDGFCTECEDEDPNYVPPTNPPTGDKAVSIALLIAALGLLGIAFVPSKRR